ncbi:MAG: stage 0 sporulation protein [Endomicrobium sp.]|jgi:cell fate regulator YaaT (PSP1 superfamily)|nr:stage 0 sporulation protein [Endomicrobium sp.]
MLAVVGVIIRKIKDKIYADVNKHFDLKLNDKIVLKTEHGIEVGMVFEKLKSIHNNENSTSKVLRKITESDEKIIENNEIKNIKVKKVIIKKIEEHKLNMKLTSVQYTFDRSKLFIYYTSEIRVDFRKFIKDLGSILKTRIQMVQIGVRDESKIVGGIGPCGRIVCCHNFLKDFNSITIDIAKDQNLLLNTAKLTGLCGRLLCCIFYESDTYKNIKKKLPTLGNIVLTPNGKAKLIAIDCIRERVTVDFGDNKPFEIFKIDQITSINKK